MGIQFIRQAKVFTAPGTCDGSRPSLASGRQWRDPVQTMPAPDRRDHRPDDRDCPCGLPASYRRCCGRYHDGGSEPGLAPTAEALMRSRYSAYVLGWADYLLATWHPETRPARLEPDPPGRRWLGLQVRRHQALGADRAEVEFVARSKLGGRAHRLHEISRFVRESAGPGAVGRWFYVGGDPL
jgi:SEC-C motif domain protein